jgi:hypothetical protein
MSSGTRVRKFGLTNKRKKMQNPFSGLSGNLAKLKEGSKKVVKNIASTISTATSSHSDPHV